MNMLTTIFLGMFAPRAEDNGSSLHQHDSRPLQSSGLRLGI